MKQREHKVENNMKIYINGETLNLSKDANVADALQQYLSAKQQKMSFAVALNSDFVSKSQYASTSLKEDDSIDILFPIHGG